MSDGEDQTPNISDVGSDGEEETSAVDSLDLPKVPSEPQPVIPELYSKFLEQQEKSEDDPPETPYKSKYAARKFLRELHGLLATELDLRFRALDISSTSSEGESTCSEPTVSEDASQRSAGKAGEDSSEEATVGMAGEDNSEEASVGMAGEDSSKEASAGKVGEDSSEEASVGKAGEDNSEEASAASSTCTGSSSGGGENVASTGGLVDLQVPRNILNMLLGHLHLQLGTNYCSTEQTSEGERNLLKAYEYLTPYRKSSECILGFVLTCNQIGYVLSNRMDHKKSLPYLKEAEDVYTQYMTTGEGLTRTPRGVHELFVPSLKSEDGIAELHRGHTHTLYFLAQVFKEMDQTDLSAQYCSATLQRQLKNGVEDGYDWALNCGTLSCYFLSQCRYADALYCLAASSCMLSQQARQVQSAAAAAAAAGGSESTPTVSEDNQRTVASVSRLWVVYAMNLLDDSKQEIELLSRLSEEEVAAHLKMREIEKKRKDAAAAVSAGSEDSEAHDNASSDVLKSVQFAIEGTDAYVKDVPTDYVADFDQARQLFLLGQRHIELARKYFSLDDHCTDYVELIQNHSKLFHRLAVFEKDSDRVCKMHRRRADMLLGTALCLNPQFYLHIVRQLRFEAAEALVSLLDIKLETFDRAKEAGEKIDQKLAKKINMLIGQAREQFEAFYKSLSDLKGNMPETLSEDIARPALLCKFHIARLHSKVITLNPAQRIQNLKVSLQLHKEIVEQCHKQDDLAKAFQVELEISREMAILLPRQLDLLSKS
ncbi:KIF-binding protein-like [Sycon ciliatum]|uniref:KIF-binding protein-like n=1 Tax=Sycon ciliatum TaxID=27933 RepID=UPI0031F61442